MQSSIKLNGTFSSRPRLIRAPAPMCALQRTTHCQCNARLAWVRLDTARQEWASGVGPVCHVRGLSRAGQVMGPGGGIEWG